MYFIDLMAFNWHGCFWFSCLNLLFERKKYSVCPIVVILIKEGYGKIYHLQKNAERALPVKIGKMYKWKPISNVWEPRAGPS